MHYELLFIHERWEHFPVKHCPDEVLNPACFAREGLVLSFEVCELEGVVAERGEVPCWFYFFGGCCELAPQLRLIVYFCVFSLVPSCPIR